MEKLKPVNTENGLKLSFRITVHSNESNETETTEKMNKCIIEHINNETVNQSIKNAWTLSNIPKINNINIHIVGSDVKMNSDMVQLETYDYVTKTNQTETNESVNSN